MYQGGKQMFASPTEALAHISEQAWSQFTKADYTLEQWHAACLIHIHDGAPTSKSQCKLPVKTPDGALNRNGVHAAAAALAGARGGLKGVSADQKDKAASALRRYYAQLEEEPPDSLKHHGVKGQKWGVRKEEELVGKQPASTTGSGKIISAKPADFQRLSDKIIDQAGFDSHLMAAKYGPPEMQRQVVNQQQVDREKLKKIAIGVGVGVGVAGLGIAAYKLRQSGFNLDNLPSDKNKLRALLKTTNKAYDSSVDGLHINWDKGVDLPKGFVLRRLSSVAEDVPRPEGFFAAHLDSDVESYKAVLPTFWKSWGVGSPADGGFINHYMAKEPIRAPSGKDSFALFKHLIDTDDKFNSHFASMWDTQGGRGKSDKDLKQLFVDSSNHWVDSTSPYTKQWFAAVKSRGYNALIDFNDAGKLGKTPLRVLDGNQFEIVKHESQGLDDFYKAAKTWTPELVHLFTLENGEPILVHVDDFRRLVQLGRQVVQISLT